MNRGPLRLATFILVAFFVLWGTSQVSLAQEEQPMIDFSDAVGGILNDGVTLRVDGVHLNAPPDLVGDFWGTWTYDTTLARWTFGNVGPAVGTAGGGPFDTYFSLAVTENGHNHAGDELLFLDFDGTTPSSKVVVSTRVENGAIRLDGSSADWDPTKLSTIRGRVINNYPLSEFFDATNTDITVGSAYDQQYIYFIVQWVDANLDRSDQRNQWVFDGTTWGRRAHERVNPNSRQANVVNRDDPLTGTESEDRVFFMFPINDTEGNFADGGLGCSAYCHGNLDLSGDPSVEIIGEGAVAMATNVAEDIGDIWHWKAARTAPMGRADDKHIIFGEETASGRTGDSGQAPDGSNTNEAGDGPAFMPVGQGLSARVLYNSAVLPFDQTGYEAGAVLPFNVMRPAQGSRGNVESADSFDEATGTWTVEFRRPLYTGNSDDHQFVVTGSDATPPSDTTGLQYGDATAGATLYSDNCQVCHQENGAGLFSDGAWTFPRVQRASGALIRRALRYVAMMSAISVTPQEAEDIAAYLQTQFTPQPQ